VNARIEVDNGESVSAADLKGDDVLPILLDHSDLRPFVRDPRFLDEVIAGVQEAIVTQHLENPTEREFTTVALRSTRPPGRSGTLLLDRTTGAILALFAGDELGALRAAVVAAAGVRHLAPPDPRVLGILGVRDTVLAHSRALVRVLPGLREIHLWTPDAQHRSELAERIRHDVGIDAHPAVHPAEAVAEADVVITTNQAVPGGPVLPAAWIRPGSLLVTSSGAIPAALLATSRRFVPTFRGAELPQPYGPARLGNPMGEPFAATGDRELAEVILGHQCARDSPEDVVIYEPTASRRWDLPVFALAHLWASHSALGRPFRIACQIQPAGGTA
jgi:ornithine cyclodeaminase